MGVACRPRGDRALVPLQAGGRTETLCPGLIPAAAAAVLIHPRSRWKDWLAAAGAIVLLYVHWMPVLAAQLRSGSYKFIVGIDQPPFWRLPLHSLVLFASGVGTGGGITPESLLGGTGGILAAAGWGLLIALFLVRQGPQRSRWAVTLIATAPLLCGAVVGVIGPPI